MQATAYSARHRGRYRTLRRTSRDKPYQGIRPHLFVRRGRFGARGPDWVRGLQRRGRFQLAQAHCCRRHRQLRHYSPGQLRHSTADWAGHHHIAGRADAVGRKHGSREQSTLVCSQGRPCHHLEPDDGAFPPREAASGAGIAPAHVHDHYPGDTDDQKSWARPGAFEALEDAGARDLSSPHHHANKAAGDACQEHGSDTDSVRSDDAHLVETGRPGPGPSQQHEPVNSSHDRRHFYNRSRRQGPHHYQGPAGTNEYHPPRPHDHDSPRPYTHDPCAGGPACAPFDHGHDARLGAGHPGRDDHNIIADDNSTAGHHGPSEPDNLQSGHVNDQANDDNDAPDQLHYDDSRRGPAGQCRGGEDVHPGR